MQKFHCLLFVLRTSYICYDRIGEKKFGENWLIFLQVTKFLPDEIFPRLSFSWPVFFPDFFFTWQRIYPDFFSIIFIIITIIIIINIIIIIIIIIFLFICKIYYYHDVLYLSWLSKAVWTKIWKCDWKQGTGKNNNNTDINTTRNCAFGKNRFSDTNSTVLRVQFEKSQTKRITFLWKKSSPTHESPLILKIGWGKVRNLKN